MSRDPPSETACGAVSDREYGIPVSVRENGVDYEQEAAAREEAGGNLERRAQLEAGTDEREDGSPIMIPAARPSGPS
ncbi:hypothetical protein [Natrinema pallidum]|uniref:hypothetical protein n=1 Tax=Natrinema pallidum TaxID=69527 RepID=UPI0015860FE7